jgi:outer membrane protein OmpA-like peptidoglycan-associated protein
MRTLCTIVAMMAVIATPASANEFLDYFEHGRSELSPQGYTMVRRVVQYAHMGHPTRILIVGHMDAAEAAELSDELSRRRAQAVATELVRMGIDPALIVMDGRGASLPARPHGPNPSDRLNRRVTVGVYF